MNKILHKVSRNIQVYDSVKFNRKFTTNIFNYHVPISNISQYNRKYSQSNNSSRIINSSANGILFCMILFLIGYPIFHNFDTKTFSFYNDSQKCECSDCR